MFKTLPSILLQYTAICQIVWGHCFVLSWEILFWIKSSWISKYYVVLLSHRLHIRLHTLQFKLRHKLTYKQTNVCTQCSGITLLHSWYLQFLTPKCKTILQNAATKFNALACPCNVQRLESGDKSSPSFKTLNIFTLLFSLDILTKIYKIIIYHRFYNPFGRYLIISLQF
jgi:hypothetical protein